MHVPKTDDELSPVGLPGNPTEKLKLEDFTFKSCLGYRVGLSLSHLVRPCFKVKSTKRTPFSSCPHDAPGAILSAAQK